MSNPKRLSVLMRSTWVWLRMHQNGYRGSLARADILANVEVSAAESTSNIANMRSVNP